MTHDPAEALLKLPACPTCKGDKGFDDTTYDRTGEWVWCSSCHGTGIHLDREMATEALAALASPAPAPNETTLISVIADIREKSGVGSKPMLSELADAIAARINPAPAPDVAAVVERLNAFHHYMDSNGAYAKWIKTVAQAATLLTPLSAQNEKMREALEDIEDMIDNCADAPSNPDSLPMMVLAVARAAIPSKEK